MPLQVTNFSSNLKTNIETRHLVNIYTHVFWIRKLPPNSLMGDDPLRGHLRWGVTIKIFTYSLNTAMWSQEKFPIIFTFFDIKVDKNKIWVIWVFPKGARWAISRSIAEPSITSHKIGLNSNLKKYQHSQQEHVKNEDHFSS